MSLARWTALEKDALNAASELDDIADQLSDLGIEASVSRTLARLLRDLVQYVNDFPGGCFSAGSVADTKAVTASAKIANAGRVVGTS